MILSIPVCLGLESGFSFRYEDLPYPNIWFLINTAKAAVAENDQMGALLTAVEKATLVTCRCAIYESLYTTETIAEQPLYNLHKATIEIYAAILRLVILAHRLYATNTVVRTAHAIFKPDKIIHLLDEIQSLESRVE